LGTDEFIEAWLRDERDGAGHAGAEILQACADGPCVNQRMTHLQRMLPLELGTTQLKQFDDAITSEVFNIIRLLHEHRDVDTVNTVHELRALGPGRCSDAWERCQHADDGAAAGASSPAADSASVKQR
jgi:hypothetical protein